MAPGEHRGQGGRVIPCDPPDRTSPLRFARGRGSEGMRSDPKPGELRVAGRSPEGPRYREPADARSPRDGSEDGRCLSHASPDGPRPIPRGLRDGPLGQLVAARFHPHPRNGVAARRSDLLDAAGVDLSSAPTIGDRPRSPIPRDGPGEWTAPAPSSCRAPGAPSNAHTMRGIRPLWRRRSLASHPLPVTSR